MKGAEAKLYLGEFANQKIVIKKRVIKKYRQPDLDIKLRLERTRSEERILEKVKRAGVLCPTVVQSEPFTLYLTFIQGERPSLSKKSTSLSAKNLVLLHSYDIIHGDYTPANQILNKKGLYIIDFGLSYISSDVEDKAIDVFTFLHSIPQKFHNHFIEQYLKSGGSQKVIDRLEKVQKRVRYAF